MTPETVVRAFLGALEHKDMAAFAAVWAEDGVQEMPYSPPGFPKRVEGKRNLIEHYAAWPEISGEAVFTEDLTIRRMEDPEWVFAEYTGRVEILPTGRTYRQTYGGLFHVVDGRIKLFREFYDPAPFTWAFDLGPEGATKLGA
jgi:ketosteroid isomerase-like protein